MKIIEMIQLVLGAILGAWMEVKNQTSEWITGNAPVWFKMYIVITLPIMVSVVPLLVVYLALKHRKEFFPNEPKVKYIWEENV